jgi:hypothetical protein
VSPIKQKSYWSALSVSVRMSWRKRLLIIVHFRYAIRLEGKRGDFAGLNFFLCFSFPLRILRTPSLLTTQGELIAALHLNYFSSSLDYFLFWFEQFSVWNFQRKYKSFIKEPVNTFNDTSGLKIYALSLQYFILVLKICPVCRLSVQLKIFNTLKTNVSDQ